MAQEMAFVGPLCRRWECANRAERCPGYASSDQRSPSTNVLLLVRPALPKKESADVRFASLGDIASGLRMSALLPIADMLGVEFNVRYVPKADTDLFRASSESADHDCGITLDFARNKGRTCLARPMRCHSS